MFFVRYSGKLNVCDKMDFISSSIRFFSSYDVFISMKAYKMGGQVSSKLSYFRAQNSAKF